MLTLPQNKPEQPQTKLKEHETKTWRVGSCVPAQCSHEHLVTQAPFWITFPWNVSMSNFISILMGTKTEGFLDKYAVLGPRLRTAFLNPVTHVDSCLTAIFSVHYPVPFHCMNIAQFVFIATSWWPFWVFSSIWLLRIKLLWTLYKALFIDLATYLFMVLGMEPRVSCMPSMCSTT
jgi:hypothetical protein